MKAFLILLSFMALTVINIFAQKENYNWCFGKNNFVTFDTPSLTPKNLNPSAIYTHEGCSVASYFNGEILFYTDGSIVYTKDHKQMFNGTGLKGNTSATQSAIIVPQPGHNNLYYVFTVNSVETRPIDCYYSIVDISKHSGYGEVTVKNVLLKKNVAEKLTAVQHKNGYDFWIIIHSGNNNIFFVYLLNKDGFNTIPVTSTAGLEDNLNGESEIGYLKASPNGTKLAQAVYIKENHFELFDFDRNSGIVTNPIDLGLYKYAYGVEFSPDGTKLYCSEALSMASLIQFDVSTGDKDKIVASLKNIPLLMPILGGALQLAPNNKIYLAQMNQKMLGVINNPNESGTKCNFELDGFALNDTCYWGLPNNFRRNCLEFNIDMPDSINSCIGENIQIGINADSGYSYKWENNAKEILPETSMINVIADTCKIYTLSVSNNKSDCNYSKSIKIIVYPEQEIKLSAPDFFCYGDSAQLEIEGIYKEINWSDGQHGNKIKIANPGIYTVECIDTNGCTETAAKELSFVNLGTLPPIKVDLGMICMGNQIFYSTLLPHPANFDLYIDSIYSASNNEIEIYDTDSIKGFYNRNDIKGLSIRFLPIQNGAINDTIFIHISSPCDYTYKALITGEIKPGKLTLWANDTSSQPLHNFCIPIYGYYSCLNSIKTNYILKLKIKKKIFEPLNVQSGSIISMKDDNEFYVVEIGDTISLTGGDTSIINYLCGTLYLSDDNHSEIEILSFDAEGTEPDIKNGEITVKYCAQNLRNVVIEEETKLTINPNPAVGEITFSIQSQEQGKFNLEMVSGLGNIVWSECFEYNGKDNMKKTIKANLSDIAEGMYFILLKSPVNYQIRKIIVMHK